MSGGTELITKEQMEQYKAKAKELGDKGLETSRKGMEIAKKEWDEAAAAGLVEVDNFKSFNMVLKEPIVDAMAIKETSVQSKLTAMLMAKPDDTEWAFSFMNTTALVMEVAGSLLSFLFHKNFIYCLIAILASYLVAYVMNWAVVQSKSAKYMLFAIVFEVFYCVLNIFSFFSTLILIIPPVFYLVKSLTNLYCAYFASQLRNRIKDAMPLGDEEIAQ
jgi:hypothetical protein